MAMKQERGTSVQMPACTPGQSDDAQVFRISLDLVPDSALIYSIDGRILEVNASLVEIWEAASADELIGKSIYSLGVVKTEQVSEAFTKISRGEAIRFEIDFLTLKSTQLRLAIMGIPLLSPTGKVERVLGIGHDITRQKAAESEQSLLVAVVNASGDAIINTSLDSSILSWNGGAEKLFGVPAKEALGRSILEFVLPTEHAQVGAAVAELSRTGKPANLKLHSLRKDGTPFDSWVNFFPTYDAQGKFSGVGAIGRDMTEMVELQRQQARLAAIVESSDDAITTVSLDQRISYWNRGAERMFGFTAAEALGQPFTLHIPPERHPHAQEITSQILAHPGQVIHFEGPNLRKDGTRLEVSTVVFAVRDGEGKVIAISAIQRDITQTKRADRENVALAAIVNASHDAIMTVSPEARIMTWNPAAEKDYGYTAEEAIGKGLELFVPPEELAQTIATTRHVVQSGQPASWEQHARRRDGRRFISAVNIFPIYDAAGNVTGVAGIGRDITQLKQIETELREARDYTRGLIESSIDAMVVVDRDLRISDGNEQLARLTEVPKKILIGSRFDSYFTDPALAAAAIEKALADGYDYQLRPGLACRQRQGNSGFLQRFVLLSRPAQVSGIFGVARDVTEQRAIQRKLAEERQYSRSLVESSPDALLVSNSELHVDRRQRADGSPDRLSARGAGRHQAGLHVHRARKGDRGRAPGARGRACVREVEA